MKALVRIAAAFAASIALCAHADDASVAKAKVAAQAWLAVTDTGDGAKSWQEAASLFRGAVTQDIWARSLAGVRGPLGAVKSRTLKAATYTRALPGAPEGEYVVVQFATDFDKRAGLTETITPMKDKDGAWRVSGYYIK